jgi:hypothetical protein
MDFFFDMYDEDEALGRDELEQLLSSHDIGEELEEDVFGSDEDQASSVRREAFPQKSFSSLIVSYLPFWARPRSLRYKPSTAGLTGVRNRTRSSTKSSVQSSETYRSRRDLFSDEEYEDAQMVADNFAATLVFGRGKSDSINSGPSDEALRDEELQVERQEEAEIEQKRSAAQLKAKDLGLNVDDELHSDHEADDENEDQDAT